ncbi:MAG: hypothetical protein DWQ10_18690, partial [Calditrichaeota bacterium]
SLFLGFIIAVLAIEGFFFGTTTVSVFVPFLLFGLPITDASMAIYRRIRKQETKKESQFSFIRIINKIVQPDKHHIHHRFVAMGMSHERAVWSMYAVALLFSSLGFISILLTNRSLLFIIGMGIISLFIGLVKFGYINSSLAGRTSKEKNIVKLQNAPLSFFQGIFDCILVFTAFTAAFSLRYDFYSFPLEKEVFSQTLAFLLFVKISVFLLSGLYKKQWRIVRGSEIFPLLKANILASLVLLIAAYFFNFERPLAQSTYLIDFFTCFFLMLIVRLGLTYFDERRYHQSKKLINVLIYVHEKSALDLFFSHELLKNNGFRPFGVFLTTSSELYENQNCFSGVPLFKNSEKLKSICDEKQITTILVDELWFSSKKSIEDEIKENLHDIKIQLYRLSFDSPPRISEAQKESPRSVSTFQI